MAAEKAVPLPPAALSERVKADLLLLLASMIWGSAFVAQRLASAEVGFFIFNGSRYLLGGLALLPLLIWRARRAETRLRRQDLGGILLAGLVLAGGSALQQWGIRYTTAANAGFITGLYVVLVPIGGALLWKERAGARVWLAGGLAVIGLGLLSGMGPGGLARGPQATGDLLELAGAVLWTGHVLLIGRIARKIDVLNLAVGQSLVCGSLSLGLGLVLEPAPLAGLPAAVGPVLYTGLMSVAIAYTLQIVGQRVAPAADAAILMSGEAPFAALGGWLLLGEQLALPQVFGCTLIFAGMILSQTGGPQTGVPQKNE